MPDFLWCVAVAGGVAPDATAKVPARKRQRTGTNCFKAGLCCIASYIGLRISYFSRLNASLRKEYREVQLLRRAAFLHRMTGPKDRCAAPLNSSAERETAEGRLAPGARLFLAQRSRRHG